jgi:hypothetical protein
MQQADVGGGESPLYGYLTTVDSPVHGVFGGYLLVDDVGRPLEFHCTTPVKVSRAQQILYGATLPAHLHGRQIGATLLSEAGTQPVAVLTDSEPLLHVRRHTTLPVLLVRRGESSPGAGDAVRLGDALVSFPDGVPDGLLERLGTLAGAVDLCEPFERIRAAIDEAQKH